MKCPLRKKTKKLYVRTTTTKGKIKTEETGTQEEFLDCIEDECEFYHDDLSSCCLRVIATRLDLINDNIGEKK